MVNIVYVTGADGSNDNTFIKDLREEGFAVSVLPMHEDRRIYIDSLRRLADDLERGEKYAIVAFGQAAAECLERFIDKEPHLVALIAYYPTEIRSPTAEYPSSTRVVVHLTTSQPFSPAFAAHLYGGVDPGFASRGSGQYNDAAASLAWYRTISVLRERFGLKSSIERLYRDYHYAKFVKQDLQLVVELLHEDASLYSDPHHTAGVSGQELVGYFEKGLICGLPDLLSIEPLSCTVGGDTIVNELKFDFKHTTLMPWILPKVPPTFRDISITLVSIVRIRGGKVYQERLYWNQASVLEQCGLLVGE